MATYNSNVVKGLTLTDPAENCPPSEINDAIREVKRAFGYNCAIAAKTDNYTLTASDSIVLVSAAKTITLPAPSSVASSTYTKQYFIMNTGTGGTLVTIAPNASEQINGVNASITLTDAYSGYMIYGDGTNWFAQYCPKSLKGATPILRFNDTEASGEEFGLQSRVGLFTLVQNTGTEASPTWTQRRVFNNTYYTSATGAVNSLSITLASLYARKYDITCRIVAGSASATTYGMILNSDTGTNYGTQIVYGAGSTAAALQSTGQTSWTIGSTAGSGRYNYFTGTLWQQESGYARTINGIYAQDITSTTIGASVSMSGIWTNTANALTTITVSATVAGGIGAGSILEVSEGMST